MADDTTLFLQDIQSLHTVLNILYMFQQSSGLKLNKSKTEILSLGPSATSNQNLFRLKWVKNRIYA